MEEEWIAGKHSVTEALRSGRTINKIWIADNAQKHLTLPITAEAKKQESLFCRWTSVSWIKWFRAFSIREWSRKLRLCLC